MCRLFLWKSDAMSPEQWRNAWGKEKKRGKKKRIDYIYCLICEYLVIKQHYLSLNMSCSALCDADANMTPENLMLHSFMWTFTRIPTKKKKNHLKTLQSHYLNIAAGQVTHKHHSFLQQPIQCWKVMTNKAQGPKQILTCEFLDNNICGHTTPSCSGK